MTSTPTGGGEINKQPRADTQSFWKNKDQSSRDESPWKNKFFGHRERLVFTRDKGGKVTLKQVDQDLFKRFSNFLHRKFGYNIAKKYTTEATITFNNVSEAKFEHERAKIKVLFYKRESLTKLLKEIETDLRKQVDTSPFTPPKTPHVTPNKSFEITAPPKITTPSDSPTKSLPYTPSPQTPKKTAASTPPLSPVQIPATLETPPRITPSGQKEDIFDQDNAAADDLDSGFGAEENTTGTNNSEKEFSEGDIDNQTSVAQQDAANASVKSSDTEISPDESRDLSSDLDDINDFIDSDNLSNLELPQDFSETKLSEIELNERLEVVEALKSQLKALTNEIEEQEKALASKPYGGLKKSIDIIKGSVGKTFEKLRSLELNAMNPGVSNQQLNEDAYSLTLGNRSLTESFAALKTTIVKDSALQREIDSLAEVVQNFSPALQLTWSHFISQWNLTLSPGFSNYTDIKAHRETIEEIKKEFCKQCKDELTQTIDKSVASLSKKLNARYVQANDQPININLALREQAWNSLKEAVPLVKDDLSKIARFEQKIHKEQAVDAAFIKLLETKTGWLSSISSGVSSTLTKGFSLLMKPVDYIPVVSFLSRPMRYIFGRPQNSELLDQQKVRDDKSLLFVAKSMENLNKSIIDFMESIPETESAQKTAFESRYKRYLNGKSFKKSQLDTFVVDLQTFFKKTPGADKDLKTSSENLQTQYETLSIFLNSRKQQIKVLVNSLQDAYPDVFYVNMQDAIVSTGRAAARDLIADSEADLDLFAIDKTWQNNRLLATAKLEVLDAIKFYADLYKKYNGKYLEYQKELQAQVAGNTSYSQKSWEENLAKLKDEMDRTGKNVESIDFNENYGKVAGSIKGKEDVLYTSMIFATTRLSAAESPFDLLKKFERQKKVLLDSLSKEVSEFLNPFDFYAKQIEEIESHYAIDLVSTKKTTADSMEKITQLHKTALFDFATKVVLNPNQTIPNEKGLFNSLFSSALYLLLSPKNEEKSIQDLENFANAIKQEISEQKKILKDLQLTETLAIIPKFETELANLKNKLPKLTKGAALVHKYMPANLSEDTKQLPKLQFYKSAYVSKQLDIMMTDQVRLFDAKPNSSLIFKNLTSQLESINQLSAKLNDVTLALLVQIEKLDDSPADQKRAKLAFIETLRTKMNKYTTSVAEKIRAYKDIPLIYEGVKKLLDKSQVDFATSIDGCPKILKDYSKEWSAFQELQSQTKITMQVESLSVADLRKYAAAINHRIKTAEDNITEIEKVYSKVKLNLNKYKSKIAKAEDVMRTLEDSDQLILKDKLFKIIEKLKRAKGLYSATPAPTPTPTPAKPVASPPTKGWFSNPFASAPPPAPKVAPEPKEQPTTGVIQLVLVYSRELEKSISKVERAILRYADPTHHKSPLDQLEANPSAETKKQLIAKVYEELADESRKTRLELTVMLTNLEHFNTLLQHFSSKAPIYVEIKKAIEDKLAALDKLGEGLVVKDQTWSEWYHGTTKIVPPQDLTISQLRQYAREFTRIKTSVEEEVNKKYIITEFVELHAAHAKIVHDLAPPKASQLREAHHILEAYEFEDKINAIAAKNETQINSIEDLMALKKVLETNYKEMLAIIRNVKLDKTPRSDFDQIKQLIKRQATAKAAAHEKNQAISWSDLQLEGDIEKLRLKIIKNVELLPYAHQKKLDSLKDSIRDLYKSYNIEIFPKSILFEKIDARKRISAVTDIKFVISENIPSLNRVWGIGDYYPITRNYVKLEDLTPKQIITINTEKQINDWIKKGTKFITDFFNYEAILEQHGAYEEALATAINTKNDLQAKGQIFNASTLNSKIKGIKKELSTWADDNTPEKIINNNDQLPKLALSLEKYENRLVTATATARNSPLISATAQHAKFQELILKADVKDKGGTVKNINSDIQKLSIHLLAEIRNSIKTRTGGVNKTKDILKTIKKNLSGFPMYWRKSLDDTLDNAAEKIKNAGIGIDQMTLEDLVKAKDNVDSQAKAAENLIGQYQIHPLKKQIEFYTKKLVEIKGLQSKWHAEKQSDSAYQLKTLVSETETKLNTYFEKAPKPVEPRHMSELLNKLNELTTDLADQANKIAGSKPKSLGPVLMGLIGEEKTSKYKIIRADYEAALKEQLSNQVSRLELYMERINSIDPLLSDIGNGKGFSRAFKEELHTKFKEKIDVLSSLGKSLPKITEEGIKWEPLDRLTTEQMVKEYAPLVEQLTAKDDKSTKPTSLFKKLDIDIGVEEIKTNLKNFNSFRDKILKELNQPDLGQKKRERLQAACDANNRHFKTALELLTFDNIPLFRASLNHAQGSLRNTYQNQDVSELFDPQSQNPIFDPWVIMQLKETDSESFSAQTEERLLHYIVTETGLINLYFAAGNHRGTDTKVQVASLLKVIANSLEKLGEFKKGIDSQLGKLSGLGLTDSVLIKALSSFNTKDIPALVTSIGKLKHGLTTPDKSGKEITIPLNQIKKFDQLLDYKNQIYKTVNAALAKMTEFESKDIVFWNKRISMVADAAAKENAGAGVVVPKAKNNTLPRNLTTPPVVPALVPAPVVQAVAPAAAPVAGAAPAPAPIVQVPAPQVPRKLGKAPPVAKIELSQEIKQKIAASSKKLKTCLRSINETFEVTLEDAGVIKKIEELKTSYRPGYFSSAIQVSTLKNKEHLKAYDIFVAKALAEIPKEIYEAKEATDKFKEVVKNIEIKKDILRNKDKLTDAQEFSNLVSREKKLIKDSTNIIHDDFGVAANAFSFKVFSVEINKATTRLKEKFALKEAELDIRPVNATRDEQIKTLDGTEEFKFQRKVLVKGYKVRAKKIQEDGQSLIEKITSIYPPSSMYNQLKNKIETAINAVEISVNNVPQWVVPVIGAISSKSIKYLAAKEFSEYETKVAAKLDEVEKLLNSTTSIINKKIQMSDNISSMKIKAEEKIKKLMSFDTPNYFTSKEIETQLNELNEFLNKVAKCNTVLELTATITDFDSKYKTLDQKIQDSNKSKMSVIDQLLANSKATQSLLADADKNKLIEYVNNFKNNTVAVEFKYLKNFDLDKIPKELEIAIKPLLQSKWNEAETFKSQNLSLMNAQDLEIWVIKVKDFNESMVALKANIDLLQPYVKLLSKVEIIRQHLTQQHQVAVDKGIQEASGKLAKLANFSFENSMNEFLAIQTHLDKALRAPFLHTEEQIKKKTNLLLENIQDLLEILDDPFPKDLIAQFKTKFYDTPLLKKAKIFVGKSITSMSPDGLKEWMSQRPGLEAPLAIINEIKIFIFAIKCLEEKINSPCATITDKTTLNPEKKNQIVNFKNLVKEYLGTSIEMSDFTKNLKIINAYLARFTQ